MISDFCCLFRWIWNFPGRLMVACQLFIQAQNLVRKTKQILQSVLQLFPFWVSLLRWILRGEPLPCPLMQGHIRLDSCLCMTEAAAAARHIKNEKYMNIKSKIVLGVFVYLWFLNEIYMCIALAGFAYINDTWLDSRLTLFFLCFTETFCQVLEHFAKHSGASRPLACKQHPSVVAFYFIATHPPVALNYLCWYLMNITLSHRP